MRTIISQQLEAQPMSKFQIKIQKGCRPISFIQRYNLMKLYSYFSQLQQRENKIKVPILRRQLHKFDAFVCE